MTWEVIYSARADKDLAHLDYIVKKGVLAKIRQAKENPYHFFVRLVELPYYKLRVGNCRVIADLQNEVNIIAILHVGHRKNIYRNIGRTRF